MDLPRVIPRYVLPPCLSDIWLNGSDFKPFLKLSGELRDLRNISYSRGYDLEDLELVSLWDNRSMSLVTCADAIMAAGDDGCYPELLDLDLSNLYLARRGLHVSVQRNCRKLFDQMCREMVENFKALLKAVLHEAEEVVWKNVVAVARTYVAGVGETLLQIHAELNFVKDEVDQYFNELEGVKKEDEVATELLFAVVVSAVSLLFLVYQYLMGHIDKGGTLTCSSGSFQFRATYISIVLFEGAYVWIKFRDVPSSSIGGGYRRPRKDKLSGTIKLSKPEARYTPPGQSGNHIYLGVCADDQEVKIKKQIAAFYYGRDVGQLELADGLYFQIPSMSREQEEGLSVKEKRIWVRDNVRVVYEAFGKEKAFFGACHHPSEDDADFCTFLEEFLSESPSDKFNSHPRQHLQDNHVQDSAMVVSTYDNQGNSRLDTEPHGSWGSEGVSNVAATSNEVFVGALTVEHCAPHNSSNSEFPRVSPILTAQQGRDQSATLSDVVTPYGTNFCCTDSTSNVLAMKVISLLEQKIQEQEQRIREQDTKIVELELENERLRAAT